MEGTQELLALDVPRVVVLHKGDHAFTYRLRRIKPEDWTEYFKGITHQTAQRGEEREELYEADSALVALVTRVVEAVEGYGEIKTEKWREALPVAHRLAVGYAVRSAGESDAGEETAPPEDTLNAELCETVDIRLDAAWSVGDEGKMKVYHGLVHRFRVPPIDVVKTFNCEVSRVRVSGSAASGLTVWPIRQAIAMRLYDEVIDSVEGYSVGGQPITSVENIRREMDGLHKAVAALALFSHGSNVLIA